MSHDETVDELRLRALDAVAEIATDLDADIADDPLVRLALGMAWLAGRADGLTEGKRLHDAFVEGSAAESRVEALTEALQRANLRMAELMTERDEILRSERDLAQQWAKTDRRLGELERKVQDARYFADTGGQVYG